MTFFLIFWEGVLNLYLTSCVFHLLNLYTLYMVLNGRHCVQYMHGATAGDSGVVGDNGITVVILSTDFPKRLVFSVISFVARPLVAAMVEGRRPRRRVARSGYNVVERRVYVVLLLRLHDSGGRRVIGGAKINNQYCLSIFFPYAQPSAKPRAFPEQPPPCARV